MKKRLFVLGFGVFALFAFQACKKDSKLLSPADWVVGSWRLTLQGSDKNGDGQFSVDEKNTVDDSSVVTFQFKAGSIGYRIGPNMSYVDTLTWSLVDHDHVLKMTIDDHGLSDDLYYPFVLDYTNETILLTDTAVKPVYFRLFKREN